jgi:hypothetical protein
VTKLKKELRIVGIILLILALGGGIFSYFFMTNKGLKTMTHLLLDHYVKAETKTIGSIQGRMSDQVVLKDVELKNLQQLPPGTVVRVQELIIIPHGWNYQKAEFKVSNARLMLHFSDNIVIDGSYHNQDFALTVFSSALDLGEVLHLAGVKEGPLNAIKGGLKNVDIKIKGTIANPEIDGKLMIDNLTFNDITVRQTPTALKLMLSDIENDLQLKGEVNFEKGDVQAKKTKITLKTSKVFFNGDPEDPGLAVEAFSRVEAVNIDIHVTGSLQRPDLQLSSDPPLSSEELMVTLATGKKWQDLNTLEQGQVTGALVKDFVDYMFFSGSGDGFFEKIGITNIKVTMEEDAKGIGFTKELTEDLDVDYEIEQKGGPLPRQQNTYQTLGADYRLSNKFFASLERQSDVSNAGEPEAVDNRLLFKYKKRF